MLDMNHIDVLTTLLTFAIIGIGFFGYVEIMRRKNINYAFGKVLVQIWTQSGKIHKYLVDFDGALLKCNYTKGAIPKELRDIDENGDNLVVYMANVSSMAHVLYPHEKGFGVNYSTMVPTVAFMEGDPDPITERTKREGRFATPLQIGERMDEQFGLVSGAFAAENSKLREDLNSTYSRMPNVWIIYGTLIAAVIMMGVSLYFNYQMENSMATLQAGLGI